LQHTDYITSAEVTDGYITSAGEIKLAAIAYQHHVCRSSRLSVYGKHFWMWTERLSCLPEGFYVVNGSKHELYSANPIDKMMLGMKADRKNLVLQLVANLAYVQGKMGFELVVKLFYRNMLSLFCMS
jgi:hypothetical protein